MFSVSCHLCLPPSSTKFVFFLPQFSKGLFRHPFMGVSFVILYTFYCSCDKFSLIQFYLTYILNDSLKERIQSTSHILFVIILFAFYKHILIAMWLNETSRIKELFYATPSHNIYLVRTDRKLFLRKKVYQFGHSVTDTHFFKKEEIASLVIELKVINKRKE